MPRPSAHKLMLSLDEFTWVAKTVARIAAIAAKVDPVPGEEKLGVTFKEHKSLQKLSDKLAALPSRLEPGALVVLNASRVEIRILQKIARSEHAAVATKIIPGYQEKLKEDPARYKPYIEASQARADMIWEVLKKLAAMVGA